MSMLGISISGYVDLVGMLGVVGIGREGMSFGALQSWGQIRLHWTLGVKIGRCVS